jgi:hypothetical protein
MARPALTTVEELERTVGAIPEADQDKALARLEQASELVRAYAGTDWLNTDQTALDGVPGAIPGVVCAIVERATQNPEGITSESAGPYSRSFGADAAARVYLTAGEKAIIRHAIAAGPLGVISTTRGPMDTPNVIDDCLPEGQTVDAVEASDPYALWP